MPKVERKGDANSGGGKIIGNYSSNVFVNGKNVALLNSTVSNHSPRTGKHVMPTVVEASSSVFANGRGVTFNGAKDSCGHVRVEGSPDVFVGRGGSGGAGDTNYSTIASTIYPNTPEGIQSLIREETVVSPYLPTYHEEPIGSVPGQVDPSPAALSGCVASKYYSLKDSKMAIIAQNGYSKEQLECRWIALCTNILDGLRDAGFKFSINSGFRTLAYNTSIGSSNTSDHTTACAVDISTGSAANNKTLFKAILNVFPYSQLIYEGNWIHIAHDGRGPKGNAKVMYTYTGRNPIAAGLTGGNLPIDLRP